MLSTDPSLAANASLFDFNRYICRRNRLCRLRLCRARGGCKPFEYSIELISTSADVDSNELLGARARLSIQDRSGKKRSVHGKSEHLSSCTPATNLPIIAARLCPESGFSARFADSEYITFVKFLTATYQRIDVQCYNKN